MTLCVIKTKSVFIGTVSGPLEKGAIVKDIVQLLSSWLLLSRTDHRHLTLPPHLCKSRYTVLILALRNISRQILFLNSSPFTAFLYRFLLTTENIVSETMQHKYEDN